MKTNTEIKDGKSYVSVEGSINSANAPEFEEALAAVPGETDGLILDAENLEYISSAGCGSSSAPKSVAEKSCSASSMCIPRYRISLM